VIDYFIAWDASVSGRPNETCSAVLEVHEILQNVSYEENQRLSFPFSEGSRDALDACLGIRDNCYAHKV